MSMRGIRSVAYVRFASVYRRFEDVDQFVNEIEGIHLPFKQNDELDLEQDSDG